MTKKKKSLRVNLDETLYQKVRYKALATDTTVAAVVRQKLDDWVTKEKPIVAWDGVTPPPTTQPDLSASAQADIYSDITVTEENQPDPPTQTDKK